MQLLLTSAGLSNPKIADFFIEKISKNSKVLMIALIESENQKRYVDISKKQLNDLGINNIDFINLSDQDFKLAKQYEVVFVCGGNTFNILDKIRKHKLDIFIKEQIENGSFYVGVSAGSIIAGENIKLAGWGSQADENEIELQDLTGFGFTDIAVMPHYIDEIKNEVDEFIEKTGQKVQTLTDNQALYIAESNQKLLDKKYD